MKKLFLAAAAAAAFVACNTDKKKNTPVTTDTAASSLVSDAMKTDSSAKDTGLIIRPAVSSSDSVTRSK